MKGSDCYGNNLFRIITANFLSLLSFFLSCSMTWDGRMTPKSRGELIPEKSL